MSKFDREKPRKADTPADMRAEIARLRRESALVNNAMAAADVTGFSGEDRYTFLAYHALVALASTQEAYHDHLMLTPSTHFVMPNTNSGTDQAAHVAELDRQLADEIAVIQRLLDLARQVDHALDDSEEVDSDGFRSHNIAGQDFDDVVEALDVLEDLPDDRPGMTLGPAGKAEWALRRLLPITGDDDVQQ